MLKEESKDILIQMIEDMFELCKAENQDESSTSSYVELEDGTIYDLQITAVKEI